VVDDQLVQPECTNLEYNIVKHFKLVLSSPWTNVQIPLSYELKLFQTLHTIFKSNYTAKTFFYLLRENAATTKTLINKLKLPRSNVYNAIKTLRELGIVEDIKKLRTIERPSNVKGGPRPTIWGLPIFCSREDISKAIITHTRCQSPKYLTVDEIIQEIISDYLQPRNLIKIDGKLLRHFIEEKQTPYPTSDLYQIAIPLLQENGIKVWR